jgi:hypothetical protein
MSVQMPAPHYVYLLKVMHITGFFFNPLTPSDQSSGRAAQLTSILCILNIYSTNIRTEYFKNVA